MLAGCQVFRRIRIVITIGVDITRAITVADIQQLVGVLQHDQAAELRIDITERGPGGVQIQRSPVHEYTVPVRGSALARRHGAQPDVIEVPYLTLQESLEKGN